MRRQTIMTLVLGSLLALAAGIWMGFRNRRSRWDFGRLFEWISRSPMMRMMMSELFWKRLFRRMRMAR